MARTIAHSSTTVLRRDRVGRVVMMSGEAFYRAAAGRAVAAAAGLA
jgi:hypothetical protein